MKAIIMGCGRLGAYLASWLDTEGYEVVVLDLDSQSFNQLPDTFKGRALIREGTDEDSLREAGIEGTDVFIAVTRQDNRNIMAAEIAKNIFNVPKVICRIYDPLRSELFQTLGLEAFSPTLVTAQLIKEKVLAK
jgi:trk system potassium uptake protein TrkA